MDKLKTSPISELLKQQAQANLDDIKEKSEKAKIKKSKPENRGRGGTKQKLIYLPEEMIKALNLRSVRDVKSQSEIVVKALQGFLQKEIDEVKSW